MCTLAVVHETFNGIGAYFVIQNVVVAHILAFELPDEVTGLLNDVVLGRRLYVPTWVAQEVLEVAIAVLAQNR